MEINLNEILKDGSKKGLMTVKDIRNGVMLVETVSTKNNWYIPVKTFIQRVEKKEFELIDATTFKFTTKSPEELFKG